MSGPKEVVLAKIEDLEAFHPALLDEKRGRRIQLFSRLGLWSLVVGMAPVVVDIVSSPWGWGINPGSILPDLGLIVGGTGTLLASILVSKELRKGTHPVRLAALAGIPFGATLVMLGTMLLTEPWLHPTPILQALFLFGTKAALVLGVSLVVLLIAGFMADPSGRHEPSPSKWPGPSPE